MEAITLQLTLAARYMNGRRLRTVLTTLAVVFGVLLTFGVNTILPAISQSFRANMLAIAGQVDLTITHKASAAFPTQVSEKLRAIEGIFAVSGSLNRGVNLPVDYFDRDPGQRDRVTALSLVGIDPDAAQTLRAYPVVAGRFFQEGDSNVAIISRSLAEALDLRVGERLTLPTTQGQAELSVVGILPARTLPGNEEVLVTLSEAQRLFNQPDQINAIDLNFETLDEQLRAEIQNAVEAAVGSDFHLGGLSSGSELLTNLQIGQAMINVMGALGLFMGGFIIFNTFRTIVTERRHDLGMLRSLGADRRMITGLILTESVLQGLVGTAAGLVLGYGFGAGLLGLLGKTFEQYMHVRVGPPVVSPALLVASVAVGVGLTLVAGLLPALKAGRVSPMEALRPPVAELRSARAEGAAFVIGAVMIGLALASLLSRNSGLLALGGVLFLIGLVLAGPVLVRPIANAFGALLSRLTHQEGIVQLAEGNLTRQPTRAAVTASATMIGLAVIVMAGGLLSSVSVGFLDALERSLGSDYLFIPPGIAVWGGNVGAAPALADELRAVPSIEAVSSLRVATSLAGELPLTVLAIDPVNYPKVSGLVFQQGDPDSAYSSLAAGRSVIANGPLAALAGLSPGDEISLLTAVGQQSYRVVAVANDYLNAKIATGYISQASLATDFHIIEDVMLQANLKPGADRVEAEAQIKELATQYPQFRLIAGQEYYDENKRIFDAAFLGLYVVLGFLAIPSLVAMLNTLAIGVIERTREIGMVRAVGATRQQIRRMVVLEALILASLGTAFGLLSGIYLARLAVDSLGAAGYPVRASFPWMGAVLAVAIGLLFGALAAVIPARQAAKLDIVAALRYE
ncbi:MAG TPA: FtsX-like permease family protein [Anaerolineales bacterium]|nr:FtsX-like permease family protein [Anaerolineales bacterium]